MSTTTTNLGLVKPELTDAADITAMNENWDKIDESLKPFIDIPANADLNTYTEIGKYVCGINARVATLTNCPTIIAFYLEVGKHAGTYQRLVEYHTHSPKIYFRNKDDSGTWGAWQREYSTVDRPSPDDIGVKSLNGGTRIANGSDLNTYKTVGNYSCISDADASSFTNCPVTTAFNMTVGYPTGQSAYLYQEIIQYTKGTRYYRECLASTGVWTDWFATYDTDNKPTPVEIGAAPTSHASSANTYGVGNASVYGHLKLSDVTNGTSGVGGGVAATPAAVKAAYDLANGKANASHTHGAAQISSGTFMDTSVKAKSGTDYGAARLRNIYAGTSDMTAGTTALENGALYFVYE